MRTGISLFVDFIRRSMQRIAAHWTLQAIVQRGGLKPETNVEEGIIGETNQTFSFFRQTEVAHAKPILDVVDSQRTMQFYQEFLGGSGDNV